MEHVRMNSGSAFMSAFVAVSPASYAAVPLLLHTSVHVGVGGTAAGTKGKYGYGDADGDGDGVAVMVGHAMTTPVVRGNTLSKQLDWNAPLLRVDTSAAGTVPDR